MTLQQLSLFAALLVFGSSTGAVAQAGKRPPQKKPGAPAKPGANPQTKGTTQLPGDNGKLGVPYTLGPPGTGNNINFTLNSVEYSPRRVNFGEETRFPKADEKALILHYSLHNPNPAEYHVDWATLKFTGVDSENQNQEYTGLVAKEGTGEKVAITLKPAQKIDVYTAIVPLPAKATVPKLIVQHNEGGGVLRYDLKGLIKGLTAPFADPKDASGATILDTVAAKTGEFYPGRYLDVKYVSSTYTDGPLGENEPEEGKKFFVATFVLKNGSPAPIDVDFTILRTNLVTSDGEKVDHNGGAIKGGRDENLSNHLKPGEEATIRVWTRIPKEVTVKSMAASEGEEARVYLYEIAGVK